MAEFPRSAPTAFSVMAVVCALLVTSCSADEEAREYAVPNKVCGVSVAPKLMQPLLPPGKSIDAGESLTGPDDTQRCAVLIDDDTAVDVT